MENNKYNLRIMTWNLGLFSWAKYAHYFGVKLHGKKIRNEYFQKEHADLIVTQILEINPDICVLQEFFLKEDSEVIIQKLKQYYPNNALLNTWYHKHSILILSKNELMHQHIPESGFHIVKTKGITFIPVHLNSFHASKRLDQVNQIEKIKIESIIDCVLGDTNFWCFSKKQYFLFKNDRSAYNKLENHFVDTTKDLGSTIKIFGLNFDKIFLSKEFEHGDVKCIRKNGKFMDHYPVFLDIEKIAEK